MTKKYKCLKEKKYVKDNIFIQAISPKDIEMIRSWRNKQIEILRQNKKISKKYQLDYFKNHVWKVMSKKQPEQILFSILENKILLGYGGLTNISWKNKRAEISFLLDTKLVSQKKLYDFYFTEFLNLIKKIAFHELKLKKLFTETFSFRKFHLSILIKNGFKQEGLLKKHILYKNKFCDSYMHGIIKR